MATAPAMPSTRASATPMSEAMMALVVDMRRRCRDTVMGGLSSRRDPDGRWPRRHRVQMSLLDDVEHGIGEEVVEGSTVGEPCSQVGARYLEAGHLDANPRHEFGQFD